MSHDHFPLKHNHEPLAARKGAKFLIDRLVSLAPFVDEPDTIEKAFSIVQALKDDSRPPVEKFSDLETLATLSHQSPDGTAELETALDDSAEYLLKEIRTASPSKKKNIGNIHNVWSAMRVWEASRRNPSPQDQSTPLLDRGNPSRDELFATVLENFPGVGRESLIRAHERARDNGIPFEEALDQVNQAA